MTRPDVPRAQFNPRLLWRALLQVTFHRAHLRHALMSNAIVALAINGRSSCITVHPDHLQRESQAQIGEHLSKQADLAAPSCTYLSM
jgi:hypothetical protein